MFDARFDIASHMSAFGDVSAILKCITLLEASICYNNTNTSVLIINFN